ncbi:hypothetical protein HMPREF9445_01609 [Bacteroides clarus YIT 12056]|uniref:Uncharacterized protein n=1 Tax=Bacteroides clarus YIT 12056 TaxID=762984 RepID=A0ABN0CP62_9BACE|nr:hypothetical protein HMPREF9445_01609 [Bacteroides clarus YIT 12056]
MFGKVYRIIGLSNVRIGRGLHGFHGERIKKACGIRVTRARKKSEDI